MKEVGKRLLKAPGLLVGALTDYVTRREKRLVDALTALGQSLPTGIFDNDPVREYVANIFSIKGRSDDFRKLERRLTAFDEYFRG